MYTVYALTLPNGKTPVEEWMQSIRNPVDKTRIVARLNRVKDGNFGDYKALGENLYELRFHFGPGWRIYFTIKDVVLVVLLVGGDKSSQSVDIDRAKRLMLDHVWGMS